MRFLKLLSACTSLEYLNIQGNSLKGSIPSSLSCLRSVTMLDLSSNNFSGPIPKFLEDLSFLKKLNLFYNHFEGEVPIKGVFGDKTGISIIGNGKLCRGLEELHLPSCHSSDCVIFYLICVLHYCLYSNKEAKM